MFTREHWNILQYKKTTNRIERNKELEEVKELMTRSRDKFEADFHRLKLVFSTSIFLTKLFHTTSLI